MSQVLIRSEEEAEALAELLSSDFWPVFERVLDRLAFQIQCDIVNLPKAEALDPQKLLFLRGEGEGAKRLVALVKDLRPYLKTE